MRRGKRDLHFVKAPLNDLRGAVILSLRSVTEGCRAKLSTHPFNALPIRQQASSRQAEDNKTREARPIFYKGFL